MSDIILEVEYIDSESGGWVKTMFDGQKIIIGKNVQDFYEKLRDLPASYKCQLLNLEINDLESFIEERQKYYNQNLISEFKKTWIWRIDGEVYNFSDKEINQDLFGVFLNKKQIFGKLKRNSFDSKQIFKLIDFFKDNEDIIEYIEE